MTQLSITINRQRVVAKTLVALVRAARALIEQNGWGASECVRSLNGWKISGPEELREGASFMSYNGRCWSRKYGTSCIEIVPTQAKAVLS